MRARAALAVAFPLVLAVTLAACGGGGNDAAPADTATTPDPAPAAPADVAESEPIDPAPAEPAATSEAIEPAEPDSSMAGAVTCDLETVPSQVPLEGGITHVDALPEGFAYNSVPASQGPHAPEWLVWGVYDDPVPELNVVHNLEHGGLTVQYGRDVSADTVARILEWYAEDSDAIIVAPHDGLGGEVALAAWTAGDVEQAIDIVYSSSEGNVLHCDGFDEAAFSDFRENYRGRAPERIPLELMPAGS